MYTCRLCWKREIHGHPNCTPVHPNCPKLILKDLQRELQGTWDPEGRPTLLCMPFGWFVLELCVWNKTEQFFFNPFIWKPQTLAAALDSGSTWEVWACVLLLDFYFIFPLKGQRHFSKAPTLWNYSQRNAFSLQETGPRGPRDRSGLVWNLPSLSVSLPAFWLAFSLFQPVNATDRENSIFLSCGYS